MNQKRIWTIGHSTHTIEKFTQMLKSFEITTLVDVRSLPGSRKFPQFNKESLEKSLSENDINYIHSINLGGRRKTSKESKNTGWRLPSFRGYADYMETLPFLSAVKELEKLAINENVAFMCAEAVWWSCHRSLISDYLKFHNWTVLHIMEIEKAQEHPYTSPARIKDKKLSYPEE